MAAPGQCSGYKQRVFGMIYRPRDNQPSMFELLSWNGRDKKAEIEQENQRKRQQMQYECCKNTHTQMRSVDYCQCDNKYTSHYRSEYAEQLQDANQEKALERVRQNHLQRTRPTTNQIKDRLYYHEQPVKKKIESSTSSERKRRASSAERVKQPRKVKQKLDEQKDKDIIEKRKERIKQFSRETRNLPNSAFKTYYGKPVFQAYGRNNTHSAGSGLLYGDYLHTHNVMPHCGDNHPKHQQTYVSALINAPKHLKKEAELPRKRDENIVLDEKSETMSNYQPQKNNFHIDLPKPDLINADRFASIQNSPKQKINIPKAVIPTKPVSISMKQVKPQIDKRPVQPKPAPKPVEPKPQPNKENKSKINKSRKVEAKKPDRRPDQEIALEKAQSQLKYMNHRQNFMQQKIQKKMRNSRLAYKVTECYPIVQVAASKEEVELLDPKDYKHASVRLMDRIPAAGKVSQKHVDIRDLFAMEA